MNFVKEWMVRNTPVSKSVITEVYVGNVRSSYEELNNIILFNKGYPIHRDTRDEYGFHCVMSYDLRFVSKFGMYVTSNSCEVKYFAIATNKYINVECCPFSIDWQEFELWLDELRWNSLTWSCCCNICHNTMHTSI